MAENDTMIDKSKCKSCGGRMTLYGNTYHCPYCQNTFDAGTFQKTTGTAAVSSAGGAKSSHGDGGVDVFEENIDGVLEIVWHDAKYKHSGSGFLISEDGYAITNTHVVSHEDGASCQTVSVRIKDQETTATVVVLGDNKHGSGNGIDLALIKVANLPAGVKVMKFEDFEHVKNGQKVYVIGNSLGYGTCITSGIVSDRLRNVNGDELLMTDCAVNGGNSGGPIFNESGNVIGAIVSGITGAEGMNFAIPSSDVMDFIKATGRNIDVRKYGAEGRTCPQCGGSNTQDTGSFWWCGDCDCEW